MTKIDYTCWGHSELISEISKLKSQIETITIDFTEGDIQEMQSADYGIVFDWEYPTEETQKPIKLIIVKTE